jgi:hypothetical protein
MNLIEFLFTLLSRFVPIDEGKYAELLTKAKHWYGGIQSSDEILEQGFVDLGNEEKQVLTSMEITQGKAKRMSEQWYAQVFLAVLYVPACIWLQDLMHPKSPRDKHYEGFED